MRFSALAITPALLLTLALPTASFAVDKCQAKVNTKTGALEVSAAHVGANPRWGGDAGAVNVAFADVGTCFAGGKLSKCHLGAPGTLAERTPPEGCIVYVNDGGTPCAALIKGCTPGARMRNASFTALNDSRGVVFNGVFRPEADLHNVNLTGADLSGANLTQARLYNANLAHANLAGADLSGGGDLSDIDLSSANLTGANLSDAVLCFANLNNADLRGANLTGAEFGGANLLLADFGGADLTSVLWWGQGPTTCPDGTRSDTNGSSPQSCCAHLNGKVPAACSP